MAKSINVIWSPLALSQLNKIGEYIAKDAPQTAADFVIRLLESTKHLENFPLSGVTCPEDATCRQVVLQGYRVIYEHKSDSVDVLAIIAPGQDGDKVLAFKKKP